MIRKSPSTCSLDAVPTSVLKQCLVELVPTLTLLINQSFQSGYFPGGLKHSNISPIIKNPKLDKDDLKNYRPIANLKFVAKTVERAAVSQVQKYASEHHLQATTQSAYRPFHSYVLHKEVPTTKKSPKPNKFILARDNITSGMTREKTIQIFISGIPPKTMGKSSSKASMARSKQTRTVPLVDSCSIVGNSGILLESNCGDVIDRADLVLRMNLAPAGGEFARDVGSKTNLTTINFEQSNTLWLCAQDVYAKKPLKKIPKKCQSFMKLILRVNNTVVWYFKGESKINYLARKKLEFYRKYYNLQVLFAFSPESPFPPAHKWLGVSLATTGAAVYLAANTFCRRITMFGFYPRYVDPRNRTL
ncbi:uncharacterized protein [Diadema setosum]|uniref:uncharacterized protein n=1 Tax=Diadema setosum TaxID=31175 RepID=UPI003B3B22CE